MRPAAAALKSLLAEPGLQVMPGCGDGMGKVRGRVVWQHPSGNVA